METPAGSVSPALENICPVRAGRHKLACQVHRKAGLGKPHSMSVSSPLPFALAQPLGGTVGPGNVLPPMDRRNSAGGTVCRPHLCCRAGRIACAKQIRLSPSTNTGPIYLPYLSRPPKRARRRQRKCCRCGVLCFGWGAWAQNNPPTRPRQTHLFGLACRHTSASVVAWAKHKG